MGGDRKTQFKARWYLHSTKAIIIPQKRTKSDRLQNKPLQTTKLIFLFTEKTGRNREAIT
ncbi:uncharacterized protein G2W53_034474 [Senna tora]|uniref:Uncharacterized protein n=1 Tax=Senna tora TaxID=362788 RepID=A0A834W9L0_9FABA|nr:uncharacterized protein G2W53_034474 [Senna tora]